MSYMIGVDEVVDRLCVSKPHAYKLIKEMNDELSNAGYMVIAGKVPVTFFEKKFYGFSNYVKEEAGNHVGI